MKIKKFLQWTSLLNLVLIQSCIAQPASVENWTMELSNKDVGLVRLGLTFEFKDSTFIAYTRKGADRDILGFWKSVLARLFSKDLEHGSLINIADGKAKKNADTLLLSGIFRSALGSYYFKGSMHQGILSAQLLNAKKGLRGTMKGEKRTPTFPLSDYPRLTEEALKVTREKIYSRSVLGTKAWISFEKEIKQVSTKVQDDIEMEFAFFYLASKLPFSHYFLLRPDPEASPSLDSTVMEKQVHLKERSPRTMYMKIESFSGTAAEMDSAFSYIIARKYENLIVDLRDNPGGSVEAGLSFASHVADSSFYSGIFLTQRWFEKNKGLPEQKDYEKLPVFTEANFNLLIEGIHNQPGLCLKIVPAKTKYTGKLFILVNSGTASACEPIVYGLKQHKRAVVVGEKTAGAMLSGEFFKLKEGFSLMLPTADYYASDGYRIDKNGVEPTIQVKEMEALDYVMKQLIR